MKPFLIYFKNIAFGVILISLGGCGFHFSNQSSVPPLLHKLYFRTNNSHSDLSQQLSNRLQDLGITLISSAEQSPVILSITSENFAQSRRFIGTAEQLTSVNLQYTVTFDFEDRAGQMLAGPFTVSSSRSYLQNASQILGDNSYTVNAEQAMVKDIAVQMISFLNSKKIQHMQMTP